jgi:phosphoribosylaminoimidazole (AIR) synthetase
MIQKHGNVEWKEMCEDFNMGVGSDVIVAKGAADEVVRFCEDEFHIGARRTGICKYSSGGNKVTVETNFGTFTYNKS